ncbi:M48 family metalloprotease [Chelatococcus sp.]|uniref:M48 family metalloprotease n=1 Tax=Chelatococcus sp. TaxID=1953771 RepID=UPI0025C16E15|nr:M48 family metalloprotease [Chelatococcus sp.]MCO5076900.1 M48 family metalloprotease [Chelatococcus sp.]
MRSISMRFSRSFRFPKRLLAPLSAAAAITRGMVAGVSCAAMVLVPTAAKAQSGERSPMIVRDAEIEKLLMDYATPVLKAAGIRVSAVKVILIQNPTFNAFVANGQKIFVNTGALIDSRTPNEIIGVLAHESGHIAGGHLARLHQQIANAKILSVVGMLAGAGAMVGSGGGRVGQGGIGAGGVLAGSQELVRRNLLSYQRSEEQAADQAAVRYLTATGQSAKGLLDTMKRMGDNALFRTSGLDPYVLSHPLPQERMSALEQLATKSPAYNTKDSASLVARHELMRAKLSGFTERPETVMRRYPPSDRSVAARYARAILAYKTARSSQAVTLMDELLREQPKNPYFWEMKGQALLESGRAREAIAPLRQAVALAPSSSLIRAMLGRAMVASGDPGTIDQAIRELSNATQREPELADAFRDLSTAYARKGDIGMAELSASQYYFARGEWDQAATQATRAKAKLKPNSPAWLRADDILAYQPERPPGK